MFRHVAGCEYMPLKRFKKIEIYLRSLLPAAGTYFSSPSDIYRIFKATVQKRCYLRMKTEISDLSTMYIHYV